MLRPQHPRLGQGVVVCLVAIAFLLGPLLCSLAHAAVVDLEASSASELEQAFARNPNNSAGDVLRVSLSSSEPYVLTRTLLAHPGFSEVQLVGAAGGASSTPALLQCSSSLAGGAIIIKSTSSLVQNVVFSGCQDGALYLLHNSSASGMTQNHVIQDCSFLGNKVTANNVNVSITLLV